MDFQQLVADDAVRAELLGRADELVDSFRQAGGGLESLEVIGPKPDQLVEGVELMKEGAWRDDVAPELEAIVQRFTRPVLLVRNSTFTPVVDGFPESQVVTERLTTARPVLDAAIGSVGRIDLENHREQWVGTGWVVAPQIVVTNSHVAELFGKGSGDGFAFRVSPNKRTVKAKIDWRREHDSGDEAVVHVDEILWIGPDGEPDVALLHISEPIPAAIPLMTGDEVAASVGAWTAVIGYPARSTNYNLADQQRIFDGIYDVKRLAPGTVMSVSPDGRFRHDATTLRGNSGSVVVDLASGKAVGLHFGGVEGERNEAVHATVVAELLATHG